VAYDFPSSAIWPGLTCVMSSLATQAMAVGVAKVSGMTPAVQ
jgi:hypothetical protein